MAVERDTQYFITTTTSRELPFEFTIEGYRVVGYSDNSVMFASSTVDAGLADLAQRLQERPSGALPHSGLHQFYYQHDQIEEIAFRQSPMLPSYHRCSAIISGLRSHINREPLRRLFPLQATISGGSAEKFDIAFWRIPARYFSVRYSAWTGLCTFYPTRPIAASVVKRLLSRLKGWLTSALHSRQNLVPQVTLPLYTSNGGSLDTDFSSHGQQGWTRITFGDMTGVLDEIEQYLRRNGHWAVTICSVRTQPVNGLIAATFEINTSQLGDGVKGRDPGSVD